MDVRALLKSKAEGSSSRPSAAVDKEDDLVYDLGHLSAYDPSPIDEAAMRADRPGYLMRTARDNAIHNIQNKAATPTMGSSAHSTPAFKHGVACRR